MADLSIFIDESGDFGPYEHHAPYYLIALVFLELLCLKYETSELSSSEIEFFRGKRNLAKNYIKPILTKRME